MESKYIENANLFKSLSDANRLMILDMLSDGELCACKILEEMNITQPTLSHHMKTLSDCGLVDARREGKWMHYSINPKKIQKVTKLLSSIGENSKHKEGCLCR